MFTFLSQSTRLEGTAKTTTLLMNLSDTFVLLFPKKVSYFHLKLIVIAGVLEDNEFCLPHPDHHHTYFHY